MKNKVLTICFTVLLSIILLSAKPVKAQLDFTWTGNCVNNPTQFTPTGVSIPSIASWQWDFGDGGVSVAQYAQHSYYAFGNYVVTLTVIDTFGISSSVAHNVFQNPLPYPNFVTEYPNPNCSNAPVQFTDLSSVYSGYILKWIWNYGDGSLNDTVAFPNDPNVLHQYPAPGTYIATLTIINSTTLCSNSYSAPVTVNPAPVANFYHTGGQCEDLETIFTDASFANGAGNIVSWSWDFGDPASGINNTSNLQNPIHFYSNPGGYLVREIITNFNSCKDTIIKTLTIYPLPPVDFTHTGGSVNTPVYFSPDPVVTNLNSVSSYYWEFGDGVTALSQNAIHTYISTGNYTSILTITDTLGCINSISHLISVVNGSVAHFSTSVPACDGNAVAFTDLSSVTSGYITSWHWDFGDGSDSTIVFPSNPNISHTYFVYGTYTVTLTIVTSDGSTATESQNIAIYPKPIANFAATQTCFGPPTQFNDLSQAGTSGIIQWLWNFGDPASGVLNTSTVQNPVHLFTSVGLFEIQLIVTSSSGCIDTLISPVLIRPLPPVDFTVSNNCVNAMVSFTPNAAVMNFGAIASWLWDFGDGNTSTLQNPSHVYMASGTYNVTLNVTDTNGCANYATKILTILAIPGAAFNYTFPACVQSAISFTDLSQTNGGGAIVSWQWDFGDPTSGTNNTSTLQNPEHTFNIPGTYLVTLTVLNSTGCSSSITMSITVNQKPTAEFTFTAPELNQPVYFTDLSLPGSGVIVTWNWNFGDGNSSSLQNPAHTYTLPGTYSVGLIVTNESGCSNFADSILNVEPGAGSVTLTGRVIAGNDTLNNANVHLIQLDATGLPVSLLTTSPGSDNEYIFNNIPEGNYYLHATPEYNGPFASSFLPTFYLNSLYWQSATLITLGQPENPYNIQLASYQIINGGTFIINGQIANAGKSINPADQEVFLLDNQNNPVRWTITDANGNFSFDSLPAGTYGVNPVITGLTTYPYYIVLNENTSPAFVKMIISGLIITANDEQKTIKQLFKIYPNPASEIITIETDGNSDSYQVEIISISGKLLYSQSLSNTNSTIDISDLPSGLYLVKITGNKGNVYQERIIKQ